MVARVDRALKDDLGIADGLAADNVYVLDPCCGTGAYLAEVLRRIAENLKGQGLGALTGARVKRAATERVFGFEIMPAPFVIAHLQVGLTMQALDAPLADDGNERAGVFLTNALTGWEPTVQKPLLIPELEEERERAGQVKQDTPILVIIGNPPYNGFAGMAVDEERELSQAYRTTRRVRRPEGQGLNDLYVRFFRMAERRIAEKTGRGVVCFISNYSWLDALSFTGMRERYLEEFDVIRIDCLNGDKYKTGKTTPDGSPDPSIFSTPEDPVGIQVGTAIATLVRKADHAPAETISFRHLWGQAKREELDETAETAPTTLYDTYAPVLPLGLPFAQVAVSDGWFEWPALPDLFPVSFPGVKTSRDSFLVDIDLERLKARVADYFDPELSHADIGQRYPGVMTATARFDARLVRDALLARGGPVQSGFVRHAYRPFDNRWLYWEAETKLLDEKRTEYKPHVFEGNLCLVLQSRARPDLSPPLLISHIGDLNQMNSGVYCTPAWLHDGHLKLGGDQTRCRPNLSPVAQRYLERLGRSVDDLFQIVLAVLHDPAYHEANADALRAEGPRIPLPGWPDGDDAGAAEALAKSAARGRKLAQLLDSDTPVPGITEGALRPEAAAIAVPATTDGRNMAGDDFALTAGWGHFGCRRRSHARPGPHRPARLHAGGARRAGRRHPDSGRNHLRHLPQQTRLLAQRPRRRLDLQARRLPGPKEVALLPRAHHPPPAPQARRSPALRRNSPPDRRHPPGDPPKNVAPGLVPSRGPAGPVVPTGIPTTTKTTVGVSLVGTLGGARQTTAGRPPPHLVILAKAGIQRGRVAPTTPKHLQRPGRIFIPWCAGANQHERLL